MHWYIIIHYNNFFLLYKLLSPNPCTVCAIAALYHRPANLELRLPFCSNGEAPLGLATVLSTTTTPRSSHLRSVLQPCKRIAVPPPTCCPWCRHAAVWAPLPTQPHHCRSSTTLVPHTRKTLHRFLSRCHWREDELGNRSWVLEDYWEG